MKINKKLILLSTVSSLLLVTGCLANEISVSDSQSSWKNKLSVNSNQDKLEDCKGNECLASIAKPNETIVKERDIVVEDEAITPSEDSYFTSNIIETIEYDYSDSPFLEENLVEIATVSSDYLEHIDVIATNDVAVQVGAFRKFSGAQKYAKRYSLMNRQYSVAIQEDIKNSKPIYRVQVNGFSNNEEANTFISRYGTQDAFLVLK
ncbi:MAG TPA: SPOR domain-containing protein [Campylobacterales bacterium]|nr:SPOR domain-containing protein [Campylobacterales bacterium]